MKKRPKNWQPRIPPDAVIEFTETPHIPGLDDYELPDHIEFDYSKAKPNRFAAPPGEPSNIKFTRGGARKGAGRKPAPEPLIPKKVYLYPRHLKLLKKLDSNLSAAIRKLADASAKK